MPSPSRKQQSMLDFPSALKAVMAGQRITKQEWKNKAVTVSLNNGYLSLTQETGATTALILRDADLAGTDWYIVHDSVQ